MIFTLLDEMRKQKIYDNTEIGVSVNKLLNRYLITQTHNKKKYKQIKTNEVDEVKQNIQKKYRNR